MNRDDALKKIKKCLALGRAAESHEAAAALRQAQKLMTQFGLCDSDVALADVREVQIRAVSSAANAWEVRLTQLVAEAFGCEMFAQVQGGYNPAGNWVKTRHYVFVGVDAAPDVAGYAYQVLSRQCARDRLVHIGRQPKNCKPITKSARGDAFALGWVSSVRSLVERFGRTEANEALLLQYLDVHHPDMGQEESRNLSRAHKTDMGHHIAGLKAGAKAQLHRGVSGKSAQGLLS